MTDVEVTGDGVQVRKTYERDVFPVPTVAFDVESTRDEAVTVRIVDEIPERFEMDQVGFHPDFGSEHWSAYPDHRVEFETELEPGESVRTVYGVRLDDPDDGEAFLGEPRIEAEPIGELAESAESAEPVEETTMSDIAPRERTDVVRDVAGGEADAVPGMESEEATANGAVAEGAADEAADPDGEEAPLGLEDDGADEDPLNLAQHEATTPGSADEPAAESVAGDDPVEAGDDEESSETEDAAATAADDGEAIALDGEADSSADGDADAPSPSTHGTGDAESVAAAVAAEIRAGDVDEADLETLRGALGPNRSRSVELEHLQSRVGELEAYTDALEAFIDEEGTASELLAAVEDDLEALDETVSDLAADVDAGRSARSDLRAELNALGDDVDAEVSSLAKRLDGLAADLDDAETDLEHLRGDLEALDERVGATEEDLDELAAVREDVDEVADDIEELRAWRDELTDVFGN